jgi:hypothetical protein
MSLINPFQEYSQKENVVTNNVLLMFSSLYDINSQYYELLIQGLTEYNEYSTTPQFRQQKSNKGNGIIDGMISVQASKVIIETKLHGVEWQKKLLKYTDSFESYDNKVLLHLSNDKYGDREIKAIQEKLEDKAVGNRIVFASITYEDLVDQLKSLAEDYSYDRELHRLLEYFETWCVNSHRMPRNKHILRAMACGGSFELNKKFAFYFDLASRGYRDFNYLGIYKNKCVHYIGKVANTIVADWSKEEGLDIKDSESTITDDQKSRLSEAIEYSVNNGWDWIGENHRFFLFDEFEPTKFKKESKGGLMRVKYLNLAKHLDPIPESLKEIGEKLRNETWE